MPKDGSILEQLVKLTYNLKFQDDRELSDRPHLIFEDVTYLTWLKIKRLAKRLNCGVLMLPEGNLNTINLISHPRRYEVTLKQAFEACAKNNLRVGCSLTFFKQNPEWMKKRLRNRG